MSIDSQTVVALLLVAWAGFYVAWRGYRVIFRRRDSGCGGCAKCPTATQTPTNQSRSNRSFRHAAATVVAPSIRRRCIGVLFGRYDFLDGELAPARSC